MSSDAFRFTIASGQVTEVFEMEHGMAQQEAIEANETYTVVDATTIRRTETKGDYVEAETLTDANGDGIFFVTEKTYETLVTAAPATTAHPAHQANHDDDGDGHDDDADDDGSDDDLYHGVDDDDLAYGSLGRDTLYGRGGDDDLDGGEDDDHLYGEAGSDDLYGRSGDDDIAGGDGDDRLCGGEGDDIYDGGDGFDIADFSSSLHRVELRLTAKGAQATGEGTDTFRSVEGITGSDFDDRLEGGRTANSLFGGDGDDILHGKGGSDSLVGGLGADTFVIDYKGKSGDSIDLEDFVSGEDTLELAAKYFKGLTATNLGESFITGSAALENDDRLIFDDSTGTLYYDKDGSGHKAAVEVAVIGTGNLAMDDLSIA